MGIFYKKKYICNRCEKEVSLANSRTFRGNAYCIECEQFLRLDATKKAEEEKRLRTIDEAEKSKFHYNVTDPVEAYAFWENEVDIAHRMLKSQDKSWEELINGFKPQTTIRIKSTPDYEYPDNREWDWNTDIWIYYSELTDVYKFALLESYNSEWDGFPVFSGGEISLEVFENYMNIIGNHEYDEFISKLKNYQQ